VAPYVRMLQDLAESVKQANSLSTFPAPSFVPTLSSSAAAAGGVVQHGDGERGDSGTSEGQFQMNAVSV
jgi:hypothetical protein